MFVYAYKQYSFKAHNIHFHMQILDKTSLHLALNLTWANLSPRVSPMLIIAVGMPNSLARKMNL